MNRRKTESIEKMADFTYDLMDAYRSGLSWLLDYCDRNNYPYPDLDRALSLIRMSGVLLDTYQPIGNTNNVTDKVTEPVFRHCQIHGCFYSCQKSVDREESWLVLYFQGS